MPAELKFNQEDDKENKQSSIAPQIGGAQGAVSSGASFQNPTSSGRFTNIQNYLNANRNNNLGQNVSGKISGVAQNVGKDVEKEREDFQNKTAQAFKPFQGGAEFAQNAIQSPVDVANNQEALQRFTTIRQGQYGGPQQLDKLGMLQAGAQNVTNLSGLTNTEGGRQTLLGSFFSNPNYSQGQKSLDNLLLQADPTQIRALQNTRSAAANLNRNLNQASSQARTIGATNLQQATQMGTDVTNKLGTENTARNKELDDKLAQIQMDEANKQQDYQKVLKDVQSGTISAADAARLGLNVENGEVSLYGLNLPQYLNTNLYQGPMTREAVADETQAARLNALAKLAGMNGPIDMSKVNQYKASTQNIADNFGNDLAAGKSNYDQLAAQEKAIQDKYNNLQSLYTQAENAQQNAAVNAMQGSNSGKMTPQEAINQANGPAYSQLMQYLYGGNYTPYNLLSGGANPVKQALDSRRAGEMGDIESRLAALRNKLRVINS